MTTSFRENWAAQRSLLAVGATVSLLALWAVSPVLLMTALVAVGAGLATLRYPLTGFALLAFVVPWGSDFTVSAGSFPVAPTEPIVALLGFVLLVHVVVERQNPLCPPWTPWILIFLAAIALSATQSMDMRASERELLKWLELAVVYLAGCAFIRSRTHVHIIVAAIVLGGVSQAFLGYFQSGLSIGPAAFGAQRAFLRAYGTFDQPNPYAGYLNLTLALSLAMALAGRLSPRPRALYAAATILIAGAVFASGSRAGLLAGFSAAVVVFAVQFRRAMQASLLGILAGLGGALLAAYDLLPAGPMQRLLTAVGLGDVSFNDVNDANFSAVERAAHWLAGVRMFDAHPLLGVGIGNYGAAYPAYHPRGWYASLDHAHNYYINIAAEAGVLGLTAYVLLAGSALWYGYAALRLRREPVFCAAGLGVIGALVATSIHNVFDVLYVHGITALLGLLMALTAAGLSRTNGIPESALSYSTVTGAEG